MRHASPRSARVLLDLSQSSIGSPPLHDAQRHHPLVYRTIRPATTIKP
ncbi:hypothetical protein ABZ419_31135 [Streptomyces cinnamoneus]